VASQHTDDFVIVVGSFWVKFEDLDRAIVEPDHHCFRRGVEQKLCSLLGVISGPESFISVGRSLSDPALDGAQGEDELSLLIVLPGKLCIGYCGVEFL
jgi:hypothetical protein